MKRLICASFLLSAIPFGASAVYACECLPKRSPRGELRQAKAVFVGEVVEANVGGERGLFRFRVERSWKGVKEQFVSISSQRGLCSLSFGVGERWLVYAYGDEMLTDFCMRTVRLENAAEDLKALGRGKVFKNPPPSNNGMHPTRISTPLIVNLGGFEVVCGRVMPGVRRLVDARVNISAGGLLMESIHAIWNLFLIFSVLSVPQLLGLLAYFRVRKYHDFTAHLLGFVIPPILFFYLTGVIIFSSAARGAQSRGEEVCGTFAGMMSLMILLGAGVQMFFSLVAQIVLHARHRTGAVSK
jgi:hypothetical protein